MSLEILTNLSASILLTCSSHSLLLLLLLLLLLDTHSLTGWIPQDSLICWFLIVSSLFCQLFFLVLSSHLLPMFVWFFMFPPLFLVHMAKSGVKVALYFFKLFSFSYKLALWGDVRLGNVP